MKKLALFATIAVPMTGCLDVPAPAAPICVTSADCGGTSQVCEEGVCWGDPPSGVYAATIAPPSERDDLVPMELGTIALSPDGWLGDITLEEPVLFSGRVESYCAMGCDGHLSLDATITITRPSKFHGGPDFRTVVTSDGDLPSGESFHVALPRTKPGELPYTITIVPNNRNSPGATLGAAEVVPPLRISMPLETTQTGKNITLGEDVRAIIDGKVSASTASLVGYRVVALGHWDEHAPLTEVSTISYTGTDGHYEIALADGLSGPVEIQAKPVEGKKPTLHLGNVDPTKSATQNLAMPAGIGGNLINTTIKVTGNDGSGKILPVAGARVSVRASVKAQIGSSLYATINDEVTSDADGVASVQMYDGVALAEAYTLRIIPAPGASVGAVFDEPVMRGILVEKQLVDRIAVGGTVLDSYGAPLGGVSITAHPALRFAWSLANAAQDFLSEIPAATTVTTNNGEFVVFVDPIIAGTWGSYELLLEQAASDPTSNEMVRGSNWRVHDIQLPRDTSQKSTTLPPITVPAPANLHGKIVDFDGLDLEGAELKLYRVEADTALCGEVSNAPATCPIPADLQGRGSTDAQGIVRLTLPRQ